MRFNKSNSKFSQVSYSSKPQIIVRMLPLVRDEKVTNSRAEDDPSRPKEALTFADIAKHNEIRKMYEES